MADLLSPEAGVDTTNRQLHRKPSVELVGTNSNQGDRQASKPGNKEPVASNKSLGSSYLVDLNVLSAWELSEGMGYVGAMDFGFQVDHPDLRSFDSVGNYEGGNILDSSGVSGWSYIEDVAESDFNVDEKQLVSTNNWPSLEDCDLEDSINDGMYTPKFIGHGTHVTGILVGKYQSNPDVGGVCKNCGFAMMKFRQYATGGFNPCFDYYGSDVLGAIVTNLDDAMENLANMGVGTINLSGGFAEHVTCADDPTGPVCKAQQKLKARNIMLVVSAGNDRLNEPQPPGRDEGTVAVGGLDESADFWNESPGPGGATDVSSDTNCINSIYLDLGQECGSNYSDSTDPTVQKIDVMAQAKNVYSTFYHGATHNLDIECKDGNDGSIDGYGKCTGTSMSAPQVAGVLHLMRSAHPLLPNGTSDPALRLGLINVLNATASRSISGLGNDDHYGYGTPDARLALETILGQADEVQMKTRLTPMFELYSSIESNYIYTPFSQLAVGFMSRPSVAYSSNTSVGTVNEFASFWYDNTFVTYAVPRAGFYVFTTNNNPFTGIKDMVPLRRMAKTTGSNRNDTYVVSVSEIESYRSNGYNFAGIEGYVLPPCSPQPSCTIPDGSIRLYRDESISLNHKLVTSASSTPPANHVLLGYVYLNEDTDNDGLIDGQEIILGTDKNDRDTDGDGVDDGDEYPAAGVPVSDPLVNPLEWLPAVTSLLLG